MDAATQKDRGIYQKFIVARTDGTDAAGGKHEGDEYFVLNITTDKNAIPALAAYADACNEEYPLLAADLRAKVANKVKAESLFITVPETTLPNGKVVPSFQVGQFAASKGHCGIPQSTLSAKPWVNINYHNAVAACKDSGLNLLTETQALAIAIDISQQDINWTGGKVGEGKLYQGLHKGTVSSAQPGDYESPDAEERRWHQLSNGERIYDFAGNIYEWIFDDVQGDENGLIAKPFAEDSASLQAPYPSMEKGMGWRPDAGTDWSGYALIRGGFWSSGANAGAFSLGLDRPVSGFGLVGFRCTK